MSRVDRALVVGGGICGLAVAVALARSGVATQVVEIGSESPVAGVGINQPGNSLRALRELGLFEQVRDAGFEINYRNFYKPDGTLLVSVPYRLAGDGIPNSIGVTRRALHDILLGAIEAEGVDLHFSCTVKELVEEGDRVWAQFIDGRAESFDLVVGADGINSLTRRLVFGDRFQPEFTGAGQWRVTVPRPSWVKSIGLYTVPGGSAGYIPLSDDTMYLQRVCLEPHPARFDPASFPEMLRARLQPFGGLIAEIRETLSGAHDIVYGPLQEVRMPPPWNKGHVIICGDAAHASTPHRTQGAGMAFEDAVVLAEEISVDRPVPASLEAFSKRRYPRVKFVQESSRVPLDRGLALTDEKLEDTFTFLRENMKADWSRVDAVLSETP